MKSDVVDAIIEIPYRSRNKFEIKNGKIKLDRVLYSAMAYPAEYGYIPNTLELDGDPLDILVISSEATFPGCVVPVLLFSFFLPKFNTSVHGPLHRITR